jgi:hypothetical protein
MQQQCREASTTRRNGKPLDNTKISEDDVADTDIGFQKVMNKHDSQSTRKKTAAKLNQTERLGSLQ